MAREATCLQDRKETGHVTQGEGKRPGAQTSHRAQPSSLEGRAQGRVKQGCSLIAIPHQLQHKGEDVDDVRVNLQGPSDVVLRADGVLPVPQDQLCVISQELQGQESQK